MSWCGMELELVGKRAIVTGGSRGIGLAIADALAAEGTHVTVVARGGERLDNAAAHLSCRGARVISEAADTRDDDAVRSMVKAVTRRLGGGDILVNSAARPASARGVPNLSKLTDDDVRVEVETKVLGYLRCAQAVAPYPIRQGWGRIVNLSGLNARQSGSLVGSIRNAVVSAMTKNLADELGTCGVTVTALHPGVTVTGRTDAVLRARAEERGISPQVLAAELGARTSIGRLVTAAEVASVAVFLASPRSVAIAGDSIAVGGGARGVIHY